ncbi:uncharacterized protein N7482_008586 [Penicillium canariense]|uniref:Uncharacterized protein n=1 Tax=Penicillium canariense TaxID=189055 RepID=A0A9W9HU21_9EURO|nr:uncharacterized protein N7482_008586 [Penicillium canariense]KAJ5157486.1 hypothetical protein N7482_008586 [Penicillium canariense]
MTSHASAIISGVRGDGDKKQEQQSQMTIARLQAENDALKRVFGHLHITLTSPSPPLPTSLDHQLRDSGSSPYPRVAWDTQHILWPSPIPINAPFHSIEGPLPAVYDLDFPELNTADTLPPPPAQPRSDVQVHPRLSADSTCCVSGSPDPAWAGIVDPAEESTTLCSLAYQWVLQCNKRGIDLHIISMWMQPGFQTGSDPLEGCRVDNQVLLSVLTQVS